jgi:hypothetical protein
MLRLRWLLRVAKALSRTVLRPGLREPLLSAAAIRDMVRTWIGTTTE